MPTTKSRGAALMQAWRGAQTPPLGQSALARLIHCSASHVANIERGEDRPSGELAFRIQDVTGGRVPAASFFETRQEVA